MTAWRPVIPVKVRTARKQHACGHYLCRLPILPGERYEVYKAPPWRDDNESPYWLVIKSHLGAFGGTGCDEAAAYRERATREAASA